MPPIKASQDTKELQQIPYVGPKIAQKLLRLGITRPSQLKNRNPDRLFEKLCAIKNDRPELIAPVA